MKDCIRMFTISFCAFISDIAFSVISPFYPQVAKQQGIPEWLIGLVFSTFPIASFLVTFILPSIMFKFGKTVIFAVGMTFIGLSNILISTIEDLSPSQAIVASFISRSLSGSGFALSEVSLKAIAVSDYPDKISIIMARMSIFIGLGTFIGPSFGSFFYSYGGFRMSCRIIGIFVLLSIPIACIIIGRSKPYVLSKNEKMGFKDIAFKPVIRIQRILNILLHPFIFFVCVGMRITSFEFHFLSYGVEEGKIGFYYTMQIVPAIVSSTVLSFPNKIYKPYIMMTGAFLLSVGYLLGGPASFLIPSNFYVSFIGFTISSLSMPLILGKKYLVPSIPYMIELMYSFYGYDEDHRLNDTISSLANFGISFGEIVGPIYITLMQRYYSIKTGYTFFGLLMLAYAIFYATMLKTLKRSNSQRNPLEMKLMSS